MSKRKRPIRKKVRAAQQHQHQAESAGYVETNASIDAPEPSGIAENPAGKNIMKDKLGKLYCVLFKDRSAFWTAVFTGVLTAFTIGLYLVADRADNTTRTSQRASLNLQNFQFANRISGADGKTQSYQMAAIWENSGATPLRRGRTHVNYQVFGKDGLPKDFDFSDRGDMETRPFVLGPKTTTSVIIAQPILVQVFTVLQEQKARLFFWGWATYSDMFDDTPRHLTEFCSETTNVISLNSVSDFTDPKSNIAATPVNCSKHNCYDADCPDYKKRISSEPKTSE